jgi:hypothetical protein
MQTVPDCVEINSDMHLISVEKGEIQYHRDVLAEYRRRVEEVMLEFFNEASVIT